MKKLFLAAACGLLFSNLSVVKGQTSQGMSDLRVQVSDALPLVVIEAFSFGLADAFGAAFNNYRIEQDGNSSLSGMWGLGYRYYVTPRFSVGADLGYMRHSNRYTLTREEDVRSGERNTSYALALPTGEFSYLNKPGVQLYGNLSAGIMVMSGYSTVSGDGSRYDYDGTSFAFQVNPIGARFGRRFGGFVELGFGFKGIATLGFSARL